MVTSFGTFSGYKINIYKSVIMFLSENERLNPHINTSFLSSKHGLTYLGITVTPTIYKIISASYNPLADTVAQLLNKWTTLPISMIGWTNILKM